MSVEKRYVLYFGPAYELSDEIINALPEFHRRRAKPVSPAICVLCGNPCKAKRKFCTACRGTLSSDREKASSKRYYRAHRERIRQKRKKQKSGG